MVIPRAHYFGRGFSPSPETRHVFGKQTGAMAPCLRRRRKFGKLLLAQSVIFVDWFSPTNLLKAPVRAEDECFDV
jgi:hypothetical protein